MGIIRVSAILATTDPIPAYGGIQFSPSELEEIVAGIRDGRIPMNADHDGRKRLDAKWVNAEIRRTEHGSLGVYADFDVDEDEWEEYGRNDWSLSVVKEWLISIPEDSSPTLLLKADAGHFDEEILDSAMDALHPHFAVRGGLLYQFSEIPPARVILEMALLTLQVIPINLISSVLYDGLKYFLKPKRAEKSIFEFRISDEGRNRSINAHIETSDPDILRSALTQMPTLYLGRPEDDTYEFDDQDREWKTLCDNTDNE